MHLISRSLYTSDTGDDAHPLLHAKDPEIQLVPKKPKKPRHSHRKEIAKFQSSLVAIVIVTTLAALV